MGRYVRIEIPGKKKTLTLAEVEVFSDGRNVARQGKATQSSTAGGDANRAIDGNKSGAWSDGGQLHTKENETNPWWKVDLGKEVTISTRFTSTTAPTATWASDSTTIASRC